MYVEEQDDMPTLGSPNSSRRLVIRRGHPPRHCNKHAFLASLSPVAPDTSTYISVESVLDVSRGHDFYSC
jgi:hypothetical protein